MARQSMGPCGTSLYLTVCNILHIMWHMHHHARQRSVLQCDGYPTAGDACQASATRH